MHVFHISTTHDWAAARRTGAYTTSTRGVTLEQEGFLHASRADQVEGVRSRYYADLTEPLLLLTIETDLLTSPWRVDPVGDDTYPHIYGPLNADAVVEVTPLSPTSHATSAAVPQQSVTPEPPWP